MERKNILFLLILTLFAACTNINKSDLEGTWHRVYTTAHNPQININEITFSADSVDLIDEHYSFKESGTYTIEENEVVITRNDGYEIRSKTKIINKDSIILFDSIPYKRLQFPPFYGDNYTLIGIETQNLLKRTKNFALIQLYKTANEVLKLRLNDKITGYRDIPIFLSHPHSKSRTPYNVLVFLGKGVKLSDLKTLYYHLYPYIYPKRAWLVTQRKGLSGFHVFEDKYRVFRDELEEYLTEFYAPNLPAPLPPPPLLLISKADFLKKGGKDIIINNKNDFHKIDSLTNENVFQISINHSLSIRDYISLKTKLKIYKKEKGIHYFTVIY